MSQKLYFSLLLVTFHLITNLVFHRALDVDAKYNQKLEQFKETQKRVMNRLKKGWYVRKINFPILHSLISNFFKSRFSQGLVRKYKRALDAEKPSRTQTDTQTGTQTDHSTVDTESQTDHSGEIPTLDIILDDFLNDPSALELDQ